jgi:hypothetical protein
VEEAFAVLGNTQEVVLREIDYRIVCDSTEDPRVFETRLGLQLLSRALF